MDRLKIAIIFGGCSEEHPISVKSAGGVAKNLDIEKYERIKFVYFMVFSESIRRISLRTVPKTQP